MIIGTYPCCGGSMCFETPDRTPAWHTEACPHCGERVWHRFSRVDPISFTQKDFDVLYVADLTTREITRRDGRPVEAYAGLAHYPGDPA